jgi:hypothetical protein
MTEAQCYKLEGRGFQLHHDTEVCSASNINEYQKIFHKMLLGIKTWLVSNLTTNYTLIIQTM